MLIQMRKYREEKNLSLSQLAKITGISKSYLDKVENGKANWTKNCLKSIANALDVCPKKLIGCQHVSCENCSYK